MSPETTVSTAISKLTTASVFIERHTTLITIVLVAALIWGITGKVENLWASHEQKVFDAKTAALQAQVDTNAKQAVANAALAKKNADLASQYQTLAATVLQENTKLEATIAQLSAQVKKQQTVDASMPPSQQAQRWASLVPGAIVQVAPGGFNVDQKGGLLTLQQLEELPLDKEEIADLQTEKINDDKQIVAQTAVVVGLNQQIVGLSTQVTGLQAQNADQVKTCAAQVAVVKANAAKSKRHWFIGGFVAGFVSGLVLRVK